MTVNRDGGTWEGGYVSRGRSGRLTYFIERSVGGFRYHVSTRCHERRAALRQLDRFESDPNGFRPEGAPREAQLALRKELIDRFKKWQIDEKGNTRKHANAMCRRLGEWMVDLAGVDLRKATLREDIIPALNRRGANRKARIIALKSFYGWMRKVEHLLTKNDDPTMGDLPVPPARPEKHERRKVVPFETVQAVLQKLPPRYVDALLVVANTGMHVTEFERFIRADESEIVIQRSGATIAGLRVRHKNKRMHAYSVTSQDALDAATRLRASRTVPRRLNTALADACAAAEVTRFTFGVMRHSVATWLEELGGDGSRLLGHLDKKTTDKFYADVRVPHLAVAPPALRLVKGG